MTYTASAAETCKPGSLPVRGYLLACLTMLSLVFNSVGAQTDTSILTVSKPPVPSVPSDAPQGHVYGLPVELNRSSLNFDTAGGPVSLEYLQFDTEGNAYISFDDGPDETFPGGIMVVADFLNRSGGTFDPARDLLITGASAGLVEPKDIVVVGSAGLVIVADFSGASLAAFDTSSAGDVAPLFRVDDLGLTGADEVRRPWGLAFDTATGRLFVGATDGTVLVFDDFLATQGAGGPSRSIRPVLDGARASVNAHDVVYVIEEDKLIVSDVGAATTPAEPGFDSDGSIFVLGDASSATGEVEMSLELTGASTRLGNPVGLAFDGTSLFVSERAQNLILRFDDFLNLPQRANVAPSGAITIPKPEAVVLVPNNRQF